MPQNLYRVAVVGPPRSGKSSVIKRIVSHRFDNLPTRNQAFMGLPSDGKYVSMLTMPSIEGLGAQAAGPSQVLVEMQDQLGSASDLMAELPWFDVAEEDGALAGVSMDGWSGSNRFLAVAAAAAREEQMVDCADGGVPDNERQTEHWARKLDPRLGHKATAAAPTGGQARPQKEQHPLMAHQFESQAKESAKPAAADERANPLTLQHGTHSWMVVFDVTSAESLDDAHEIVAGVLERVNFERGTRRPCPVSIVLVGNKQDLPHGVGIYAAIAELVAQGMQSVSAVVSQLHRQNLGRVLLRVCDQIIQKRRALEEARDNNEMPSTAPPADEDRLGGVSAAEYLALQQLRAALDPVALSSSSCTEYELLLGAMAALRHPLAHRAEVPPAEVLEGLFACPALAVKYVGVSCRTNEQVRSLERVLLRSIRLLPSAEKVGGKARRKASGGAQDGSGLLAQLGHSLSNMFSAVPDSLCAKAR